MIILKCLQCDRNYETFPCRKDRKYCSRKCAFNSFKGISRNRDSLNVNWKGDKVGLKGLHMWIRDRKTKPLVCEECKIKPPYDLANISQEYRRDINDFRWLCRSCHKREHDILEKRIITKKCSICKVNFTRRKSLERKFCSNKCEGISRRFKIEVQCKQCNKQFYVKPSDIKYGRGKHCSMECYSKSQENKIRRYCLNCGNLFYTIPAKIRVGWGKFCNIKCMRRYRSGKSIKNE